MNELFALHFFRNAFLVSLILGPLFGLLSFYVVMRKMAFLGAGIAHTAFGGVALGVLTGLHPMLTSLVFCVFAALLMGKLVRTGRISYDSSIGIFFSLTMALGVLFIAWRKAYTFDLSGYLFGNILGVSTFDLGIVLLAGIIFIPFFLMNFQKLLYMIFDEKVAVVNGVNTGRLDALMLGYLAVIIVISIKIVGIILVSALVVLPASFGLLFSRAYRKVVLIGVLYTVIILTGGLFISYFLDLPAGAAIVVLGAILYFIAMGFVHRRTL